MTIKHHWLHGLEVKLTKRLTIYFTNRWSRQTRQYYNVAFIEVNYDRDTNLGESTLVCALFNMSIRVHLFTNPNQGTVQL